METSLAVNSQRLVDMEKVLYEIHERVVGNGKPGLDKRVDRLENSHRAAVRAFWIAIAALVTTALGIIANILTKGKI